MCKLVVNSCFVSDSLCNLCEFNYKIYERYCIISRHTFGKFCQEEDIYVIGVLCLPCPVSCKVCVYYMPLIRIKVHMTTKSDDVAELQTVNNTFVNSRQLRRSISAICNVQIV